ncbi:DUF882 domain-containing protein [Caulobacter hibisci]|uniref:Murein endopeptidase K n=1 Tax=Caulobacter hibisci TaxID=2035993 RepID=A0ABS0T0H0_9CAUL|nr:DUF882 domain-containing protein [Caulobacter hibisci]MBI1685382.1 DUF882 domain-containing protein [Caulobacter hibisci]
MIERRKLLGLGLGVLGASAVGPMAAFAQSKFSPGADPIADLLMKQDMGAAAEGMADNEPPTPSVPEPEPTRVISREPRWLKLHNVHTQEKVEAVYFEKGAYVPDAVQALDKVLRDYRTGDVAAMNPKLFDIMAGLASRVESKSHFQIISGYRSPKTNAMLHARSGEVAKRSLHMDGKAIDLYLEDVSLDRLRTAALDLKQGGVGYYPVSNFVHVDVGAVRRWVGS